MLPCIPLGTTSPTQRQSISRKQCTVFQKSIARNCTRHAWWPIPVVIRRRRSLPFYLCYAQALSTPQGSLSTGSLECLALDAAVVGDSGFQKLMKMCGRIASPHTITPPRSNKNSLILPERQYASILLLISFL